MFIIMAGTSKQMVDLPKENVIFLKHGSSGNPKTDFASQIQILYLILLKDHVLEDGFLSSKAACNTM